MKEKELDLVQAPPTEPMNADQMLAEDVDVQPITKPVRVMWTGTQLSKHNPEYKNKLKKHKKKKRQMQKQSRKNNR